MTPHASPTQEIKKDIALFRIIKENWTIILVIVGIIIAWANMGTAMVSLQNRTGVLEVKAASVDERQTQELVQLSAIQTDLSWIKAKLK